MKNDNDRALRDFFENPFTVEYTRYIDEIMRMAVSGITASFNVILSMLGEQDPSAEESVRKVIDTQCMKLMRAAELSKALAFGGDSAEMIETDDFLHGFAAGLSECIGDRCEMVIEGKNSAFVRCDTRYLRYLMLSFIRNVIAAAGNEKVIFTAGCESLGSKVKIYVRSDHPVVTPEDTSEVFDAHYKEINDIFASIMGAVVRADEFGCEIVLPEENFSGSLTLNSSARYFENGRFTAFTVMLEDLKGSGSPDNAL